MNFYNRKIIDAAGLQFNKNFLASQLGFGSNVDEIDLNSYNLEGVCAGAAIYPSSSFKKLKERENYVFDPEFFAYYEDVDLSLRLSKKNGIKFKLIPESVVYHHHSGTGINNSPFKTYYLTRNFLKYTEKNLALKTYKKIKFKFTLFSLIRSMKFLINRDLENFKAIYKGLMN